MPDFYFVYISLYFHFTALNLISVEFYPDLAARVCMKQSEQKILVSRDKCKSAPYFPLTGSDWLWETGLFSNQSVLTSSSSSALQPLDGSRPAQLSLSILSGTVLRSVVANNTSNPQPGGEICPNTFLNYLPHFHSPIFWVGRRLYCLIYEEHRIICCIWPPVWSCS